MTTPFRGTRIDHLVYTVPDLATGIERIAGLLGTRPVIGGCHPTFGTHNALLSVGPETYLEIIAPDPALPRPSRGLVFGMDDLCEPRLATWALRTAAISEASATAAAGGLDLGPVESGSRSRPDGTLLSWRLTDPRAMHFGGALPFLIDWGDTPHPAGSTPRAGELIDLTIEHPRPDALRAALALLGVPVAVRPGRRPRLTARVETENGIVELT